MVQKTRVGVYQMGNIELHASLLERDLDRSKAFDCFNTEDYVVCVSNTPHTSVWLGI